MRIDDVNAKKAYIQNIRKSFDAPERRYEFEKEPDTGEETESGFPFFKVRLLLAAIIFAAYIFCDKTNTKLYHFTSKDIAEKIMQDFDYTHAKEEVLQVFSSFAL